jgi:chaperone required for assembly of F1-ATPase
LGFDVLAISLKEALPTPNCNTPIDRVITLRKKYEAEFLRFQHAMDDLFARSLGDEHQKLVRAGEEVQVALIEVSKAMKGARLSTVFNTTEILLTLTPSAIVGEAASLAGMSLPSGALAGLGVGAMIAFAKRKIHPRSPVPENLQNDFAYLYRVKELE